MKNTNKKGFTIVELVIVIAVIAILAAVLIPTFASIVKKANIAADTQLTKNLNTALAAAEAGEDAPDTFTEVLKVLRDSGYLVGNLNPTTEGWYYVWESESNQILLVDGNDNFSVKYKSKELEKDTICDTWNIAVSDPTLAATLKAKGAKVAYSVLDVENIQNVIDAALAGGEVVIAEGITLDNDKTISLDNENAEVTLKLGNSVVTASAILSDVPFEVKAGKLNLEGGNISALSGRVDADGKYVTNPILTSDGTYTKIDGTVFTVNTSNGGCYFLGDADISNATFNTEGIGVYAGVDAQIVLDNVTINSASRCVWVTNWNGKNHTDGTATITIKSGNYNGGNSSWAPLSVYSGDVVVEGGTFTSNTGKFFYVMDIGSIKLSGDCTFGGKTLTELGTEGIKNLCFNNSHKVVDNGDGSYTITKQ